MKTREEVARFIGPFGLAPIKREGGVSDPDAYTWECDLDKCEKCRAKYNNWKQKYLEDQQKAGE